MTELFTTEWIDVAVRSFDATLLDSDFKCAFAVTVLSGPEGDVPMIWHIENGRLRAEVGSTTEADVVFTASWNDAVSLIREGTRPAVLYMQGRLKASGDMLLLLELLRLSTTPTFDTWRKAVVA